MAIQAIINGLIGNFVYGFMLANSLTMFSAYKAHNKEFLFWILYFLWVYSEYCTSYGCIMNTVPLMGELSLWPKPILCLNFKGSYFLTSCSFCCKTYTIFWILFIFWIVLFIQQQNCLFLKLCFKILKSFLSRKSSFYLFFYDPSL